jgi:hypothetical protein
MGWDQVADATTVVGDGSSSSGGGKARRGLARVLLVCVCGADINHLSAPGWRKGRAGYVVVLGVNGSQSM